MKICIFIFFIYFVSPHGYAMHPVHVSVVNLDLVNDSANISIQLFYDDFQSLINHIYNTYIDFKTDSRLSTKEQAAISDYVNSKLVLKSRQEVIFSARFLNWKVSDYSVWLYFTIPKLPKIQEINIENKLMLDLYTNQTNLMILSCQGKEQGFEFDIRTTNWQYILP